MFTTNHRMQLGKIRVPTVLEIVAKAAAGAVLLVAAWAWYLLMWGIAI